VGDRFAAQMSVAPQFCPSAPMPYDPTLPRDAARQLRTNITEPEQKLWWRLRKKQLDGFKFRRQYSIGPFFVDFICLEARLIVELDGSQHDDRRAQDESRSAYLRANGYTVLRFWNSEVMTQIDSVIERIAEALNQTPRPKQKS
jgi:very-short-patch-repair endonuclease